MKKKLMMVAVLLGALSLGACVDDNESASVTAVRDAKAQQLIAMANLANAQAEAAKIVAEAEAAYQNALAEMQKAMAAAQQQETAEAQARFEAELEAIKAEAEARLWEAKKNAAKYEQEMMDQADERLKQLYATYSYELSVLTGLQEEKAQADYDLVRYKTGLASVDEYVTTQTANLQADIDRKTAEIEAWKTYSGIDRADLETELDALLQAQYEAFAKYETAKENAESLYEAAYNVLDLYDATQYETSSVEAVAAVQKYGNYIPLSGYRYYLGTTWDEVSNALQYSWNMNNGVFYDSETGEYYVDGYVIYNDGKQYYVSPVVSDTKFMSVDTYNVYVSFYTIRNEETKTFMNQYYTEGKEDVQEWLGSPATDSKLATGWYLTKEQQEEYLAEVQKALTEAEEAFPELEKAYKTASDARDAAWVDFTAKSEAYNAANDALNKAYEALNEAQAGGDQDKIDVAQKAVEDAQKVADKAVEAYNKAVEAYNKADSAYYEAEANYYNGKNAVSSAKEAVNSAELSLANTNDIIESYTNRIANWDVERAAWDAVVAALENPDYAAEVERVAQNEAVVAYVEASIAANDANEAYWNALDAVSVVNNLLYQSDVYDPAEQIRQLEADIANLNTQIASLKELFVNGLYSVAEYEKLIAQLEARVEGLASQIEVQQAIVEMAKARVEEAIADMTPAA